VETSLRLPPWRVYRKETTAPAAGYTLSSSISSILVAAPGIEPGQCALIRHVLSHFAIRPRNLVDTGGVEPHLSSCKEDAFPLCYRPTLKLWGPGSPGPVSRSLCFSNTIQLSMSYLGRIHPSREPGSRRARL
jgi:hypothetical protein